MGPLKEELHPWKAKEAHLAAAAETPVRFCPKGEQVLPSQMLTDPETMRFD